MESANGPAIRSQGRSDTDATGTPDAIRDLSRSLCRGLSSSMSRRGERDDIGGEITALGTAFLEPA
jgi:hypothetical protein